MDSCIISDDVSRVYHPQSSNLLETRGARSHQNMPSATDQTIRCKVQSEPQLNRFGSGLPIWSDTSDVSGYHRYSAKQQILDPEYLKQSNAYLSDVHIPLPNNKSGSSSRNVRQVQMPVERTREYTPHCHHLNEVVWSDVPAPNGGWGWLIVAGSFLCLLTVDGVVFSYGLLMHQAITEGRFFSSIASPHSLDSLTGPSLAALSLPGGLFCGITWLIGPLVGALTNRFGYRFVAMLGAVLVTIACLLSGLVVKTIGIFTVTFGLVGGIGCGLIYLPAITVVGYWFEHHRALVVGLTMCGSGVGAVLLAIAFRLLSTHASWHATFVVIAGLFCQNLVGIALFRPLHIHEIILMKRAARRIQISKSKKKVSKTGKTSWWKALLQRAIKPTIPRGSIMARIIEEKSRQRTSSTGSLDGMVITRNNELVALPAEACEIAIAAASIYAGNQFVPAEPEQSLATTVLIPKATSKCVAVPGAHSQNLETLQEGVTFSPVSSPVYEVSTPQVYFTPADVLRTVFTLIRKLQAADLLIPQSWNSATRIVSIHPSDQHFLPVFSQPRAISNYCVAVERHKGFRNVGSFQQNTHSSPPSAGQPSHSSRWMSDKLFHRSRMGKSRGSDIWTQACDSRPSPVTSSRVSSQLTSMVSLDSRTDQFIIRELNVLPLDRSTKLSIVTALRTELSRPKYRIDLFYPGSSCWASSTTNRRQLCLPTVSIDYSQVDTTHPAELQTLQDEVISFVADPPETRKYALESTGEEKIQLPGSYSRTTFPNYTIPMNIGKPETFSTIDDSPPNEFTTYLRDMLDTQLLKRPTFLLMLLACSLNVSVLLVPFHYLPLLLDLGGAECRSNSQWCPTGLPYSSVDDDGAASLFTWITDESAFANHVATLVVIAIAGIVGRLVVAVHIERGLNIGLRSRDRCQKLTDPMLWNNSALVLCGLSLAGLPLAISGLLVHPVTPSTLDETHLVQYWSMETRMTLFFFSALGYGFANAISLSLRSVILVDLFGIRHLTNAFGYLLIVQGISAVIGPTLFGYFCDSTCHGLLRHYSPLDYERSAGVNCTHRLMHAFYACAAIFLFSACLFAPLRWLNTLVVCSGEQRPTHCCRHRSSAGDISGRCPSPQCFELNATAGTSYDPQETQTTSILPDSGMLNNGLTSSIRSPVTPFNSAELLA